MVTKNKVVDFYLKLESELVPSNTVLHRISLGISVGIPKTAHLKNLYVITRDLLKYIL